LNEIYLIGLICLNSAVFLILGHYITAKSHGTPVAKIGRNKPTTKQGTAPPRSDDAVVPEWGDQ